MNNEPTRKYEFKKDKRWRKIKTGIIAVLILLVVIVGAKIGISSFFNKNENSTMNAVIRDDQVYGKIITETTVYSLPNNTSNAVATIPVDEEFNFISNDIFGDNNGYYYLIAYRDATNEIRFGYVEMSTVAFVQKNEVSEETKIDEETLNKIEEEATESLEENTESSIPENTVPDESLEQNTTTENQEQQTTSNENTEQNQNTATESENSTPEEQKVDYGITSVQLSKESINLTVGKTYKLRAKVLPTKARNKSITWKSDDESVATVESNGTVTAVGSGTTTIFAVTADESIYAECEVIVANPIKKLTLDQTKLTLSLDDNNTEYLTVNYEPEDADNSDIVWSSSDPTIATVEDGLVTALKEGKVKITATNPATKLKVSASITIKADDISGFEIYSNCENSSTKNWCNENVEIDIDKGNANSVTATVNGKEAEVNDDKLIITEDGKKKIKVVIKAIKGSKKKSITSYYYVDKTPPSKPNVKAYELKENQTKKTSKNLTEYDGVNWTKKGLYIVAYDASDNASGLDHYEYKITKAESNEEYDFGSSKDLMFKDDGYYKIQFRACDKAENCSEYSEAIEARIDTEAPTLEQMKFVMDYNKSVNRNINNMYSDYNCMYNDESGKKCLYTPEKWAASTVYLSGEIDSSGNWQGPTAKDSESGVDHFEIKAGEDTIDSNGKTIKAGTWVTYNYGIDMNQLNLNQMYRIVASGEYERSIRVCDKAGNCSDDDMYDIKIDLGPKVPTSSVNGETMDSYKGTWTNEDIVWDDFDSDSESGIKKFEFFGDNNGEMRDKYVFSNNGVSSFRIRAVSNSGVASEWSKEYVFAIDKSKPKVPTSQVNGVASKGGVYGWTKQNIVWNSFSADDEFSGVDHYEYSTNCTSSKSGNLSNTYTYSKSLNYKFCIRSVDKAGNTSDWSNSYTFRIDKDAPTVPTLKLYSWGANLSKNPTSSSGLSSYTAGTTNRYPVFVEPRSTDNFSGVNAYYFITTGATENLTNQKQNYRNIVANGTSRIKFKACDNVGNCSAYSDVSTIIIKK